MQSLLPTVQWSQEGTLLEVGGAEQSTDAAHCSHCSPSKVEVQAEDTGSEHTKAITHYGFC